MKPIYAAVDQGQSDAMDDLLSPVEADLPQSSKDALLGYCLAQCRADEAMVALSAGADPNARVEQGNTMLMRAMSGLDMEGVVLLLVSGADPNLVNEQGNAPAHAAAMQDVPVALELLARYGADLGLQNRQGYSPVQLAARHGSPNAVQFLLEAGVAHEHANLVALAEASNSPSVVEALCRPPAVSTPRPTRRLGM